MATKRPPLGIRLPDDLKAWIEEQAYLNRSSQNSEVVRAVRAAMERENGRQKASEGREMIVSSQGHGVSQALNAALDELRKANALAVMLMQSEVKLKA